MKKIKNGTWITNLRHYFQKVLCKQLQKSYDSSFFTPKQCGGYTYAPIYITVNYEPIVIWNEKKGSEGIGNGRKVKERI